ncbi:MAG: tetratricopeptide repeat protein [Bacteroidota bacterium]
MPQEVTAYRVFIASPSGLDDERRQLREILQEYNASDAMARGMVFVPVSWNQNAGGVGRPQAMINDQVRSCDFFICLLHDRWGSRPFANSDSDYSSGTEEEFYVARECYDNPEHSMAQLMVCFKAVDPKMMADPGRQLQPVLEFKEKLEAEKEVFYRTFDRELVFERIVRQNLAAWSLMKAADQQAKEPESEAVETVGRPPSSEAEDANEESSSVSEAWRLADNGEIVEAEVLFARAAFTEQKADAMVEYGRFLTRLGRLDQARAILGTAREIAREAEEPRAEAMALRRLGNVLRTRGDLEGAETMHRRALEINERMGNQEGMAANYGNLGNVLQTRGDLDGAESMYHRSLEINERLGSQEGIARHTGNLGLVLRTRGDLKGAEAMYRRALEIDERMGRQEGIAANYGNLGLVLRTRGNLEGAETMHRRALEINERLGRQEGMANNYGNLGLVFWTRGDLDAAELMYRRALEINERMGRQEGMAINFCCLGDVLAARGDVSGARDAWTKSRTYYGRVGIQEWVDRVSQRLSQLPDESQPDT